jgi:hypothetical protein
LIRAYRLSDRIQQLLLPLRNILFLSQPWERWFDQDFTGTSRRSQGPPLDQSRAAQKAAARIVHDCLAHGARRPHPQAFPDRPEGILEVGRRSNLFGESNEGRRLKMSLPAPPVRPDLDLRAFHYMAVDVVRLRDSEFALRRTGDEFRAGFILRCASWHQKPASSLPNDDVLLAFLAGFGRDIEAWLRVRDGALDGFIECSDGRLYHPEIAEKALEAEKQRDLNRARTTAATDARRRQRGEDRDDQRDDDCDDHQRNKAKKKVEGTKPIPTQTEERVTAATDEKAAAPPPETLSQVSVSVLKEVDAPRKALASIMGTELPADWIPSDELCEEVKRVFCMNEADLEVEVPAFHALNAQAGTVSRDWNATFRLFCKRWKEHRDKKAAPRVELTKQSDIQSIRPSTGRRTQIGIPR